MHIIDIIVIVIYAFGMLGLGYLFKNQSDKEDFFLGGRSFGWFEMGMSTMASQLSAISFISAAAFVGLKQNGGMQWLTFEFAVPLAMLFLMVILIPPLYKAGVVSIYSVLEKRFGQSTRSLISAVFQFSRAFATGIMIYTVALVLSAVMEIPQWQTILISGAVTIIYSYQGGMKAVVWGDVIQMMILVLGIVLCIFFGLKAQGGWTEFTSHMDASRLQAVDFNWGIGEGQEFGFWPMLIGGFFLYISYYGCDQSQAQRSLSGKNLKEVRRALMFNGLFRFPVTFCYCLMGLIIGTYALNSTEFMSQIPADKPDYMIPVFILNELPVGFVGLLLVAILAAAMSSLSSAINSLSAATVEDFIVKDKVIDPDLHLKYSKRMTLIWGLFCILLAFSAGNIADTVIEAINKVGSAFYGPIVATFLMGILTVRTHTLAINIALLTGVGVNVFIWLAGIPIFWIWWNFIGAIITVLVALVVTKLIPRSAKDYSILGEIEIKWVSKESIILLVFFVMLILFSMNLDLFIK